LLFSQLPEQTKMINTLPYLSFIPAHVLMGIAILFFFLGKVVPRVNQLPPSPFFLLILVIGYFLEMSGSGSQSIFFNLIQVDSFSRMINQIFFIVIGVTVIMMLNNNEIREEITWEVYGLLSTVCLGMMFMTTATHLLMTALAIEMVSIPSYILVAMNRSNPVSKEAALKYVLFGSFSAGIMLYGMSLLFGLTGSLVFESLWKGLGTNSIYDSPIYLLALMMTLAGMVFKIAAAPFHFWCPDAYQAAPTPITAFLSTAPKVAGLALLIRFFSYHVPIQGETLTLILSVLAMLTMTIGNLAALRQTDIKRLLAYSSISHAGFLLMGIAVLNPGGRDAVYFYIPVYLLMNLGAFMSVIHFSKDNNDFRISSYTGLIGKMAVPVIGFTICLFSLAGLPPFAGFIGKFYLFKVVIEKQLYLLAVVAAVNSVIALYYYVNIIKVMIIDTDERSTAVARSGGIPVGFVTLCAIPIVIFGVYWQPLLNWVEKIRLLM
jgi:NADH-quinone oxidoreductase subunit N